MYKKLISIIIVILCLSGCTALQKSNLPPADKFSKLEYNPEALRRIKLQNSLSSIKRGYNGSINIKGMPGTSYTITATYREGNKILTARETRTAGSDGQVNWRWRRSEERRVGKECRSRW